MSAASSHQYSTESRVQSPDGPDGSTKGGKTATAETSFVDDKKVLEIEDWMDSSKNSLRGGALIWNGKPNG